MKKYKVILDTETTGLIYNYDRIIEISCIKIKNRKIYKKYNTYLNVDISISDEANKIHGINNDFLKDKPSFYEIAYDFLLFIYNCDLIIHNSKFDINFINYELKLLKLGLIKNYCNKIIDTLLLSRSLFPKKKNSLNELAKRFNINYNRKYHSALIDAKILLEIYLKLTFKNKKLNLNKSVKKEEINYTDSNIFLSRKDKYLNKYFFNNFLKI